jgi:hypothetical protein
MTTNDLKVGEVYSVLRKNAIGGDRPLQYEGLKRRDGQFRHVFTGGRGQDVWCLTREQVDDAEITVYQWK